MQMRFFKQLISVDKKKSIESELNLNFNIVLENVPTQLSTNSSQY